MGHTHLTNELRRVTQRYGSLYVWTSVAACSLTTTLVGVAVLELARQLDWAFTWAGPALVIGAIVGIVLGVALSTRRLRDPRWVARRIEKKHPELETLLLAAVEQEPDLPDGGFGFLQASVIGDALAHASEHGWRKVVPLRRLLVTQLLGVIGMSTMIIVTNEILDEARARNAGVTPPSLSAQPVLEDDFQVTIEPGDTQIERGASLIVTARFPTDLPEDAVLEWRNAAGETTRTPMSLSLSDPIFGGRVPDVLGDLTYRVRYADQTSRDFQVTVYEHPELQRADAQLVFPDYTHLDQKRVEDTRRVTAVEGTQLTLSFRLNKPIAEGRLVAEDVDSIELTTVPGESNVYSITQTLQASGDYRLELIDSAGRENKLPPRFVIKVTPNLPADVKIAFPARDVRVSPLEELDTQASVWDDYGLTSYGIAYGLIGKSPQDVALGASTGRNERLDADHQIAMETLAAEPDELLSYYFWAEDVGPDGQPRRALGDMYFAEVRHWEEIFRQGEPPPESEGESEEESENAQDAAELAELQKQIINATWTVIRRETKSVPSEPFAADIQQLLTSQAEAIAKLTELADQIEDAQSLQYVAQVERHMYTAVTNLKEASTSVSSEPLDPALLGEQAAYQALLKLRAREHEVAPAKPPSKSQSTSASNAQSRAQQQLDELELEDSPDRYETQSEASSEEQQADRETLQVLNRLRELAQRQNDLNERMKELQSALEEAQTEEEREEIRRQLERLRQQEEEILRDTDELDQRMQRPENQERMAEAQQQMEETRQNIRETSEALQEGQVSQAVAAGTRAERELTEMRDEFRKQASNRFSEEVRQLREDAQRLDEKQTELGQQLREEQEQQRQPDSNRLRDSSETRELGAEFQQQREDLGELLNEMQETIREAEEAEPLMAGQLYDAFRGTQQNRVEDALRVARDTVDVGLVEQAQAAEAQAAEGIRQLRQGVEEAAESVLGDEDEALRRAHDVLTELAEELDAEIQRGESPQQGPPSDPAQPAEPQGDPQPGQQPSEQPGQQPGQQPSEQPGQQPSEQPGQQPSGQPGGPGGENSGGIERITQQGDRPNGPFTGESFLPWSDRLRDVEEMVGDPDLRAEAARIRDRARGIRRDWRQRDFKEPEWGLVREMVAEPLAELRDRMAEELLRRRSDEDLVPIDRDPVPRKYSEQVRRYFEQLGRGE